MVKIRDIFTVKLQAAPFCEPQSDVCPPRGGRKDQILKACRVSLSTSILPRERPFNEQNVQNIKARHHGCNK